jgi:Predicted permease
MEGHAAMDMTIQSPGSLWHRLRTRQAFTSVSHIFVMEWAAVIRDIGLGLLIAGAVAAWVPDSFWGHLFLTGHPLASELTGPLIGPVVSLLSFVCSIGNVPLAAVLWNAGISFGGFVAFIFADLIIVPILVIYRKYYGTKMMLFILGTLYIALAVAGYLTELIFGGLGAPGIHLVELPHRPEHHLPAPRGGPVLPAHPHRRHPHAQDDGRRIRRRKRTSRPCRALRNGARIWTTCGRPQIPPAGCPGGPLPDAPSRAAGRLGRS